MLLAVTPWADHIWRVALPAVLGLLAVYLLLPRPRWLPRLFGALLALLAVIAAGFVLLHVSGQPVPDTLFYFFAFVAVVSGGMLVTQRDAVHGALSFALVVLSTCGLFLILAAPFLMAATIIVYAGAIIVTFLFVIMLAQQSGISDADSRSRELLDDYQKALLAIRWSPDADQYQKAVTGPVGKMKEQWQSAARAGDVKQLANILNDVQQNGTTVLQNYAKLKPPANSELSTLSVPSKELNLIRPGETVAPLGRSLFTDYLIAVELAGTLLLAATIGTIAIAARRTEGLR